MRSDGTARKGAIGAIVSKASRKINDTGQEGPGGSGLRLGVLSSLQGHGRSQSPRNCNRPSSRTPSPNPAHPRTTPHTPTHPKAPARSGTPVPFAAWFPRNQQPPPQKKNSPKKVEGLTWGGRAYTPAGPPSMATRRSTRDWKSGASFSPVPLSSRSLSKDGVRCWQGGRRKRTPDWVRCATAGKPLTRRKNGDRASRASRVRSS